MDRLLPALYFLQHRWKCDSLSRLHSPFLYSFAREVLQDRRQYYFFDRLRFEREQLIRDKRVLDVEDHGAGSRSGGFQKQRTVASIARTAMITPGQGEWLFRLVRWGAYRNILELGTSLGMSAAYMAGVSPTASVTTIEGSPAIAEQAKRMFQKLKLQNIRSLTGTFDQVLPDLLTADRYYDLVYIDGNHQYDATLRYVEMILPRLAERSVLLLDDIHWSKGMHQAWTELISRSEFTYSADLYFKGLLFMEPGLHAHQHCRLPLSN